MTTRNPSRRAKAACYLTPEPMPGVTLAHVITAITEAHLPARRKRDLISDIKAAARVLGAELDQLPALPRLLTDRLNDVAPLSHGIQQRRWNNIRSSLTKGLSLMAPVAPGRHLNSLAPPWQALWDYMRMKGHRKLQIGLSRFMRFCSADGVEPAEVTAEVYHRFAASLDNSLLKNPGGTRRSTRCAWAKAKTMVPGWPDIDLPKPPPRPGRYSLPLSTFPQSFQDDLAAWLRRLAGEDLFDGAVHRPLRPESLANREYHLRSFASALVRAGHDSASLRSLADLVEPSTMKRGFRFLLDRNNKKSGRAIEQRAETLVAVARHWVSVEPEQLRQIKEIASRLHIEQDGLTERNLERLRQFDDPANVDKLLNLPHQLFTRAESMRRGQRAAVLAQTAIAIALLIVAPMRMRNLSMIDLDKHLVRPGRSRDVMLIVFERSEVKNRHWLDYPIPEDAVRWLEHYLTEYRPLLAPPGSTALFPALDGGPKGRDVLGPRISRVIFEHTGLQVNPHLFRHIAAKLYLEAEPGSYEAVRRLLGHKSIATTTSFYTGLEGAAAARHYDALRRRLLTRRSK